MKTRLIAIFSLLFILLLVSCDESEEIEPVADGETAPEKMMYILTEFTYENRTREVDYDSSKVVPLRLANSGLGYMTLVEPQTRAAASTGDLPMPFTDETAEIRNELGEFLRLSNGDYIVIYKHILIDMSAADENGHIIIGLDDYVYMLARLDKDGQVLWEKPIRDIHESLWDNYYVFMDNDENLYFRMKASDNNDWQIAVVSTDGELLFALEAPEGTDQYSRYIIQTSDGQVYSACADRKENKIRFFPVDTENRCFGEENKKLSIPYDAKRLDDKSTGTYVYIQSHPFSSHDSAYLMYYYDNTTVYGVDETGTTAPVFRWLDVGLSSDVVRDIYAENDYFFIEVNEEANGGYRAYSAMISPVPISSVFGEGVTEIPTLKLAVDTEANGNYSGIISYAAKFIRSGGCRVEVVSYSDTEGGLTANQKLAHDISKGNAPDMVIFGGGLSYEILSDSGIFTDLYPLMDKSEDYSRDKLLPCVLKPFENGSGELCRLVTEYDLLTLTANKKYVGDKPGWSFDDYTKVSEKLTGDQYMFGVMDKSNAGYSMLEMILPLEIGEFIDYDAGKCDLDGLRKLLELCNNTKKGTFGYRDATVTSSETMILRCSEYYRLDEFLADRYIYFPEGEGVQIGYPTPDGKKSGTAVRPLTSLAITKQCQSKDVAWKLVEHIIRMKDEKIKGAVSEPNEFREGMVSDALFRVRHFTCSRSGIETWVAYGKEREYAFTSAAWGLDIDSKDLRSDQRQLPVNSLRARMTDADAKAFMSLFENTDMVYIYEPSACGIILEDASMYFAGEKTLDEVMNLITDRINTMIAE